MGSIHDRFGSFDPMSDDRVLCIPNISEGRDSAIIDGIVASLSAHDVEVAVGRTRCRLQSDL